MSSNHQVNIHAELNGFAGAEVLSILASLVPLQLNFSPPREAGVANELLMDNTANLAMTNTAGCSSRLRLPVRSVAKGEVRLVEMPVRFEDNPDVPFPFRGLSISTKVPVGVKPLVPAGNEKILASTEHGPLWLVAAEDGVRHYRSAFALPVIPEADSLISVLNGERFLELLPLLCWIQGICAGSWYERPPLRASFIIDDPNLHWPRYGFVNYSQIAAQAAKENYHVTFATIPLDTWFTHRATAELFRRQAGRISLCVHGNNHTKKELAQVYPQSTRVALLRQAICRIERFEFRTGLKVARVMVPPHGACVQEILEAIPHCGFEAACISHGSLRAHNKTRPWTKNLGWLPAELIQGCPVLPRWSFAGNATNTILLAAFLHQPIILRGHHQDFKGGIELLGELAGVINSLGNVTWSGLTNLSRANYRWRMDGVTCRLEPLGRKITFPIPNQTARLIIENRGNGYGVDWQIAGGNGAKLTARTGEEISLSEQFGRTVSVELGGMTEKAVEDAARRPVTAAFIRRLLTEGRDRLLS